MVELRGPAPTAGSDYAATTQYVDTAIATRAPLASPAFTGSPTAPTPSGGDNSTKIATTAFVQGATGAPTRFGGQTAGGSVYYQRIATMDGVGAQSGAHLSMLVTGLGDFGTPLKGQGILQVGQRGTNPGGISAEVTWVQLGNAGSFYTVSTGPYTLEVWWSGGTYQFTPTFVLLDANNAQVVMDSSTTAAPANLVAVPQYTLAHTLSPAFSGVPTAPTPSTGDNSTTIATTAYVQAQNYVTASNANSTFLTIGNAQSSYLGLGGGTLSGTLNLNTLNAGSAGVITSTSVRSRLETAASGWAGGGSVNSGTAVGSTTAFVTVNTSGILGRLDGSPRFPSAYSDAITTRAVYVGSTGQLGTSSSSIATKNLWAPVPAFSDDELTRWLSPNTYVFSYKADEAQAMQVGVVAEEMLGAGYGELIYFNEQEDDPETGRVKGQVDGFAYEKMPVYNRLAIAALLRRIEALENAAA